MKFAGLGFTWAYTRHVRVTRVTVEAGFIRVCHCSRSFLFNERAKCRYCSYEWDRELVLGSCPDFDRCVEVLLLEGIVF